MPITKEKQFGINKDGEFIDKVSMREYIEMNIQFSEQAGMIQEEMREH